MEKTVIEEAKTRSPIGATPKVDESTGIQIEIPFVPAAHRKAIAVGETDKDTIVVVGQPKAKKRKRTKGNTANTAQSQGKDPESVATVDTTGAAAEDSIEAEPEIFNFANVPNILDDNPDLASRKPLKKKPKKGKGESFNFTTCRLVVNWIAKVDSSSAIFLRPLKRTASTKAVISRLHSSSIPRAPQYTSLSTVCARYRRIVNSLSHHLRPNILSVLICSRWNSEHFSTYETSTCQITYSFILHQ